MKDWFNDCGSADRHPPHMWAGWRWCRGEGGALCRPCHGLGCADCQQTGYEGGREP